MNKDSNGCRKQLLYPLFQKKVDLEDLVNYASIGFDYETKAFYAQHFIWPKEVTLEELSVIYQQAKELGVGLLMKTKLKELRKLNNLSMDKLGKEINMSSGENSDIENGKKKDPRISTLIKIADYFNISLDELIVRKLED